ncbi:MerR family transcriptional regulator [Bradyrhizobium australafricanum]|uniref:MerR family transcriptional regulator n=1 Tax=Bradyrhizobium australafricanum TaxID=2821406 RepID=UPI001CE24E79|nr:MerR family transcriptional regulator [Bradyrhizobium australafricanum]
MNAAAARFLSPSEAARQLGISAKALRLYEERGLIAPGRTPAGWRAYGPAEMARGAEIVELRALGLSIGEVARILSGDAVILGRVLAAHEAALEVRIRQCGDSIAKLRRLRADLGGGRMPATGDIIGAVRTRPAIGVAFDLPWPWGGERFELRDIKRLNYIVGPLGSGKARLAQRLAEALPGASFVGLDRAADGGAAVRARLDADPAHDARVAASLATLLADGAVDSPALTALLAALEAGDDAILVIDMLEQGLDAASQEAVIAHLRRRGPRPGRYSSSPAPTRSWISTRSATMKRSSCAPPITAGRSALRPSRARRAMKRSRPALLRPRSARAPKARSRGGRPDFSHWLYYNRMTMHDAGRMRAKKVCYKHVR